MHSCVETKIYFVLPISTSHCLLMHGASLLLLLNISLNLNHENNSSVSLQRLKYSPLLCARSDDAHVAVLLYCRSWAGGQLQSVL